MLKDFLSWFRLKPKIDNRDHKPPLVSEGQIWWCHLGENIGTEINGKDNGSLKSGSWFVKIRHQDRENLACLHQVRVIDYRRIQNFVTFLTRHDLIWFARV